MHGAGDDAAVIAISRAHPERFAAIFDRHFRAIHGYVARRVGVQVAEELAGETFRIAFEQRDRFDTARSSALPWLYGIAANLVRTHARGSRRQSAAYRRAAAREVIAIDEYARADECIDAAFLHPALVAALRSLHPRDRECVLLHVWEELTSEQIAQALDIPRGTVRSRLHRVRKTLREHLERRGEGVSEPLRLMEGEV